MHGNPVVPLLLAISLILCAARLAGAAARKLGQPRVLGELLVGVALGPTLVNLLHWPPLAGGHLDGTIKELAELGVLILMFNIALEIQPRELMAVGRTALYAGVLGAAVPLGVIAFLTWGFGFPVTRGCAHRGRPGRELDQHLGPDAPRARRPPHQGGQRHAGHGARGRHPGHHARVHLRRA